MNISLANLITIATIIVGSLIWSGEKLWRMSSTMTRIELKLEQVIKVQNAMIENDKARIETWWKHYDKDFAERGKK